MKANTERHHQIRKFSVIKKKIKASPWFPVQLQVVKEGKAGRRKEETVHPPQISPKI